MPNYIGIIFCRFAPNRFDCGILENMERNLPINEKMTAKRVFCTRFLKFKKRYK
jgi:hypothetical protein